MLESQLETSHKQAIYAYASELLAVGVIKTSIADAVVEAAQQIYDVDFDPMSPGVVALQHASDIVSMTQALSVEMTERISVGDFGV